MSWVDWDLLNEHADLHAFVKKLISFRKAHACLRRTSFFTGKKPDATNADILWFGKDGKDIDWEKDTALACLINGHREFTGDAEDDDSLLLMFNPGKEPVDFILPPAPDKPWILALTTEEDHPVWRRRRGCITLDARSTTVLASAPFYRFWR